MPAASGRWRVEVYVPGRYGARTAAYGISTKSGGQSASLAQSAYGETWVALGTFAMGTTGSASLNNYSGQSGDCTNRQYINAAQMRWVYVG